MPYLLRPQPDDTYHVIDKITGESVAAFTSHSKAVRDIRRRYAEENRGKVHPWFDRNTSS